MRQIIFLFGAVLIFPVSLYAQVRITEVMYDLAEGSDSGREWIEVQNIGSSAVDLSTWRLFESGTNHKISEVASAVLSPDAFAVLADNPAKFKTDWPDFSGTLFDSAFSLSNDGEILVLRNGKLVDVDLMQFSNETAQGTGDSLQLVNGSFSAGIPTPGAGVPAGGLVLSPQKKTKKSNTKDVVSVAAAAAIVGDRPRNHFESFTVPTIPTSNILWWSGPLLCALVASIGIMLSRHYRKDEWEIEEMFETG